MDHASGNQVLVLPEGGSTGQLAKKRRKILTVGSNMDVDKAGGEREGEIVQPSSAMGDQDTEEEEKHGRERGEGGEGVEKESQGEEEEERTPEEEEEVPKTLLEEHGPADEGDGDEGNELENENATGVNSGPRDSTRIIRAQSAWMHFLSENRQKVRDENPGLRIGSLQKILSEKWKHLGDEDKARYNQIAAEDKARMKQELQEAGLNKLPSNSSRADNGERKGKLGSRASPSTSVGEGAERDSSELVLPLSRVRKTVRLDPAVGNISREGLHLVTKATEVFMATAAERAWRVASQTGRKSIKPCDLADCVFSSPEMYWLRDEFRSERSTVANKEAGGRKASKTKPSRPSVAPKGTKSITSFFGKA